MSLGRNALLGACLALPMFAAPGHAQTVISEHGRTITVPPGAVVLIIPGSQTVNAAPAAAPSPQQAAMLRMIAQQQADMQRMFAQMNAMLPPMPPMPDPSQLFQAAFGAGGPMLAGGPGVCSQSITIVQHGNSAPVITRSQSGCGPAAGGKPANVRDLPPTTAAPAQTPELIQAKHTAPADRPPHNWLAER